MYPYPRPLARRMVRATTSIMVNGVVCRLVFLFFVLPLIAGVAPSVIFRAFRGS